MKDGILVINKAQGMTSHDVVALARRRLGQPRIGHAGTLDPIAKGVLVLLIGHATKHQQQAQHHRKRYEAVVQFGTQTDTGDAWGNPVKTVPVPAMPRAEVERVFGEFVGPLAQVPPAFSAVKVRGHPLYWWARKGMPQTAKSRTIEIFSFELLELEAERLRCQLTCSSGTYVRTLAEAMAERLGTVGHVSALTRLSVGPWELSQARECQWLAEAPVPEIWAALQGMAPCASSPA